MTVSRKYGWLVFMCVASGVACAEQAPVPTTPAAPTPLVVVAGPILIEQIGEVVAMTASAAQGGTSIDVTATAQWTTDDPLRLTILGPGQVQARAGGGAQVLVTYQGQTGSKRVLVASAEDCSRYDPSALLLWEGGSSSNPTWTLVEAVPTGGFWAQNSFVHSDDAQDGLTLARHYTHSCYSGRGYGGPDRASYLVSYRRGGTGPLPALIREDCDPYDPARIEIRPDSPGWTVFDGTTRVARLFFEEDAARILVVARQHQARCYIGRGRTYSDGRQFATSYFR
jgi:hypothetical protein